MFTIVGIILLSTFAVFKIETYESLLLHVRRCCLDAHGVGSMQTAINVVDNWCKHERLLVIAQQIQLVTCPKKNMPESLQPIVLVGQRVVYLKETKYLGVWFEKRLT